ncbi:MAG: 3-oxoacyl-ACP synthase III family protein, partial [Sphingobacterium sp.]
MFQSKIAGLGYYVPKNIYTNNDLTRFMDTSDEWIQERTGIKERRYADRIGETTTSMAVEASKIAIERANTTAEEIDFIIFATLSPDYYFPGCGVLLQRELKMKEIGALDVRNQCSGFIYALSIADQFIKTGMYKNILVVGSEKHSFALDFSTRGRAVSVIFGDGAGAVVLQASKDSTSGILSTHLHSDGADAEKLAMYYPGASAGCYLENKPTWPEQELGGMLMTKEMLEDGTAFPY